MLENSLRRSLLPHFEQEEDRCVIIRFGHDYDETCMQMDEVCWVTGGDRQRWQWRHFRCLLLGAAALRPSCCKALRFDTAAHCPVLLLAPAAQRAGSVAGRRLCCPPPHQANPAPSTLPAACCRSWQAQRSA